MWENRKRHIYANLPLFSVCLNAAPGLRGRKEEGEEGGLCPGEERRRKPVEKKGS